MGKLLNKVNEAALKLERAEILAAQLVRLIVSVESGQAIELGTEHTGAPLRIRLSVECEDLLLACLWRLLEQLEDEVDLIDVAGMLAGRSGEVTEEMAVLEAETRLLARKRAAERAKSIVSQASHEQVAIERGRRDNMIAARNRRKVK